MCGHFVVQTVSILHDHGGSITRSKPVLLRHISCTSSASDPPGSFAVLKQADFLDATTGPDLAGSNSTVSIRPWKECSVSELLTASSWSSCSLRDDALESQSTMCDKCQRILRAAPRGAVRRGTVTHQLLRTAQCGLYEPIGFCMNSASSSIESRCLAFFSTRTDPCGLMILLKRGARRAGHIALTAT